MFGVQINLAGWSVEQAFAFSAFETPKWRLIASQFPCGSKGLETFNIRKSKVELYCSVKRSLLKELRQAKEEYDIPFMCFYVDLFTSKINNQKYVGIRTGYMNRLGQMKGNNIAIRVYTPMSHEFEIYAASELLIKWCHAVCAEFEISIEDDCLTSSSDSGPDVKRALEKLCSVMREWCISHWLRRA